MSYSEKDGSAVYDGERYYRIGGPPPPGKNMDPDVARYEQRRRVNLGALDAMNAALAARAESDRWTAAGLLATFRNWRNRR